MSHIQESEKIYHSCLNKNKDGSNRLFKKGDRCCTPTNSPFWKRLVLEHALKKKNKKS